MNEMPTLLLVHGSWHGPWCWDHLIPALEQRGIAAVTVSLPSCGDDLAALKGLPDDAAVVTEAAAAIPGDVVVLGHSYGGAVLSEAAFGANVRRLVFLGAFMPDTGRPYPSYLPPGPLPPFIEIRDGAFGVAQGYACETFYWDCAPDVSSWAEARLSVQSLAVLGHPITKAAWHDIPSTYVVLTQDKAVPTVAQREFAKQADEVITIEGSHSPMLARPELLADHLLRIVRASAQPALRRAAS